jgi:hypothetical protein
MIHQKKFKTFLPDENTKTLPGHLAINQDQCVANFSPSKNIMKTVLALILKKKKTKRIISFLI